MKRNILIFSSLIVLSCCTGCFELIEELSLNADGSGHVSITFNGSKSKNKLNSVMLMDSINGYVVPSKADINQEFFQLKKDLNAMSGISGVKLSLDSDNFIYTVEGNFSNVSSLNNALNRVVETSLKRRAIPFTFEPFTHFSLKGNTFNRIGPERERIPDYKKMKFEDRKIFESGEYRAIYRFPVPIQSASNPRAVISKNGKAMMFHASVKELMNQRVPMKNTIKF
ncbi:MAG: hypothetical protein MRZ79_12805 [Bacteroidia bacterium]|nr:hypothetical protein [Bacteroidia bacterium]